jgi:3-deoxy-manno-octulosonate cytidylyltransferase (CMP-KDO synthetase)
MLAIIVPVRRASTRLPDKPLYEIKGKPLVLHVAERLRVVAGDIPTYFAVDDQTVKETLEKAGFNAVMTDPDLPNGTCRVEQANREIKADLVINCQGDEPGVRKEHIELLADSLKKGAPMATLALGEFTDEEFMNPNRPKVVVGSSGQALYFSRWPIPYDRGNSGVLSKQMLELCHERVGIHQGLYAYTAEFLTTYAKLPASPMEQIEKLEQLRVLENGYPIHVRFNSLPMQGIDTPEDVKIYEKLLK